MNLQSKKARIPIAALGAGALVCGIGALATPAYAAGETLSFLGATGNAATIVATSTTQGGALTAFGLKVSGQTSGDTRPLEVQVISAPASANLRVIHASGNAVPGVNTTGSYTTATPTVTVPVSLAIAAGDLVFNSAGTSVGTVSAYNSGTGAITLTGSTGAATQASGAIYVVKPGSNLPQATTGTAVSSYTIGDNLYFGGATAGTYTFRVFRDTNGDDTYSAGVDDGTPVFTLTSKAAADLFTLSTPTSVEAGAKGPMASVTTTASTSDIRGGATPALASAIGNLLGFTYTQTGVTGAKSTDTGSYSADNGLYSYIATGGATGSLAQSGSATHTVSTALAYNGVTIGTAKSTEVTTNGVVSLDTDLATGQTDNTIYDDSTGDVTVRPGTGTVTYTAKALDGASPAVALSGKTVTFQITAGSGTLLTDLTANGAAVPSNGQVTATTGSDGIAKLAVVSTKTADGNAYTVAATSGAATVSPTTFSTAYEAAAVSDVKITSKASDLTPTVGTASVTVKGSVVDQYGVKLQPPTGNQQVNVTGGAAPATTALSGGDFSYVYTPATAPTAGTSTVLTFTYDKASGPDPSAPATVQWASAAVAATLTLTTPADGAKGVTIERNVTPIPTQANAGTPAFGNTLGSVTGTVFDATNTALAYKTVTLKGGNGVWFSTTNSPDADDKLVDTLDVVTNSSGAITGAFVYFTKAGDHTVTATSGAATKTSTVTVLPPVSTDGYTISVDDVSGAPGSTLIVTGKVTDIFGNPVPNADVNLGTGTSTVGSLGDPTIQTNADGVFSTTFLSGSNQSGTVELTADIDVLSANPTPNADLVTAGLTGLVNGVYQAKGKIVIAATKLTLSSTAKVVAGASGGTAKLSGKYLPDTSVDIYSKESGERSYSLLDSVTTDSEGEWGISTTVDKSTYFLAKANGLSSPSDVTEVWSKVSLTAKALGKGKVSLSANGDPNTKATLSFYRSVGGPDMLLKRITSSTTGSGKVTVSLPKGTRSVYVTYKAPGTGLGQSKVTKVAVK